MKLFIDTASLEEIKQATNLGVLDGVTTNPSLMKAAVEQLQQEGQKIDLETYIKQILKTAKGVPVSLEVTTHTHTEMVEEGKRLYKKFNKVANNVYIKIPVTPSFDGESSVFDGITAIKELTDHKIPVNTTLIFTPEQALMAAKAGASFVSPFAGRIDDLLRTKAGIEFDKHDYFYPHIPVHGHEGQRPEGQTEDDEGVVSGVDLVAEIVKIFRQYHIECEVLAASIRNRQQLKELALVGTDVATVPFSVIQSSLNHIKTQEGMRKFTEDVVDEYAALGRKS